MAADQEQFHREKDLECLEKEEDGQARWEDWEWESDVGVWNLCLACGVPQFEWSQDVDGFGSARDAFEPRVSGGPVQGTDGSS